MFEIVNELKKDVPELKELNEYIKFVVKHYLINWENSKLKLINSKYWILLDEHGLSEFF